MTKGKRVKFQKPIEVEEAEEKAKKSRRFKENHSLDSDEELGEDDKRDDPKNVLTEDDIEGQEEETIRNDEGITVTPFNLREELEEGHFDAQGNYIPNKTAEDVTDQWLESADWDKIENQAHLKKIKNQKRTLEDEPVLEPLKIMQDMVAIMKSGENVLKALRRLGGNKKPQSSADRWKKKKLSSEVESVDEKEEENKANLLKLTGLADDILQGGDFQIYEKTYEQLNHEIKNKLSQFEDAEEEGVEVASKKAKLDTSEPVIEDDASEDDELEAAFNKSQSGATDLVV